MISEEVRKRCTVKLNWGRWRKGVGSQGVHELLYTTWEAVPLLWGTV